MTTVECDIAVIGAGLAGLAFAVRAQGRKRVVVVESSATVGGQNRTRVATLGRLSIPFEPQGTYAFYGGSDADFDLASYQLLMQAVPRERWLTEDRTGRVVFTGEVTRPWPVEDDLPQGIPGVKIADAGAYGASLADEYGVRLAQFVLLPHDAQRYGVQALRQLDPDFRAYGMPRTGRSVPRRVWRPKGGWQEVYDGLAGCLTEPVRTGLRLSRITARRDEGWRVLLDQDDSSEGNTEVIARTVVYTKPLMLLTRFLRLAPTAQKRLPQQMWLDATSWTSIVTTDAAFCSLAEGVHTVWRAGASWLHPYHKIVNVGLLSGLPASVVTLHSTGALIPKLPGEIARTEHPVARPLPTRNCAAGVAAVREILREQNFHLLGRLAEWQPLSFATTLAHAVALAREIA